MAPMAVAWLMSACFVATAPTGWPADGPAGDPARAPSAASRRHPAAPRDGEIRPVQAIAPSPAVAPPIPALSAATPLPNLPALPPPTATAAPFGDLSGGLVGGFSGASRGSGFAMLGDNLPMQRVFVPVRQVAPPLPMPPGPPQPFPPQPPPPPPSPRLASALAPSVRSIKIAENQSPIPQDRLIYSFNYFSDLNRSINEAFEAPIRDLKAYRHILGFEKTFSEGLGSFGLRVPINTLDAVRATDDISQPSGPSTAMGDLSIFVKHILRGNPDTGRLLSVGLVVTPPTGPDTFADAPFIAGIHTITFQPFLGYLWTADRFFLHGFSSFDFPANPAQATFIFNDVGLGYVVYRAHDPEAIVSAVVPTFEVHVNVPINHRNPYDPNDPAGSPDVVNLTYGVNVGIGRRAVLTGGLVTPVTGPRPFDVEVSALLNIYFGGPRVRRGGSIGLPMIGG